MCATNIPLNVPLRHMAYLTVKWREDKLNELKLLICSGIKVAPWSAQNNVGLASRMPIIKGAVTWGYLNR